MIMSRIFKGNMRTFTETIKLTDKKLRNVTFFFLFFFFYLAFFSRTFTNHGTAGEGGGHFFNSSLPFPPASQALRH